MNNPLSNLDAGVGYKCLTKEDLDTIAQSKVPIPENEALRIFTLKQTELLDSDTSDPSFDRFASLAQRMFDVPICLVSLVDIDRQWFKANIGLEHVPETHRDIAFCAYTVLPDSPDVFVIEDALLDYRFKDSPLVLGDPHIRFYAGAALVIDDVKIGSLCIIDRVPHMGFSSKERMNMLDLGAAVSNLVRERRDASLRSSKECAKMMNDMMVNVRAPLKAIAVNTEMLLQTMKDKKIRIEKCMDDDTERNRKSHKSLSPSKPKVNRVMGDSLSYDEESLEVEVQTLQIIDTLTGAVGQLKVIVESTICLGDFVVEKAESEQKEWASFTSSNVFQTIKSARKTLQNIDMFADISWEIDSTQLSLGKRHVFSPKAVSFVLLNSVEQLASQWKKINIHVSFQDNNSIEYDCIIQQLEEAPICDIESTWRQGLLEIVFELSSKRDNSENECDIPNDETPQGYLTFYSLQQILKDVEGGCTILDTGSSYTQKMKVWMPCAIIMAVQGDETCDVTTLTFSANNDVSSQRCSTGTNSFNSVSASICPAQSEATSEEKHIMRVEDVLDSPVDDNCVKKRINLSHSASSDNGTRGLQLIDDNSPRTTDENCGNSPFKSFNGHKDMSIDEDYDDYGRHRVIQKKISIAASLKAAAESAAVLSAMVDEDLRCEELFNLKRNSSLRFRFTGMSPTREDTGDRSPLIRKLRVLLVEDTLTQQKLMGKWLTGQGCEITYATNGKIGLELLKTRQFEICFMDFLMPVMTGSEAIKRLNEWCLENAPPKGGSTPPHPRGYNPPQGDDDRGWWLNKEVLIVGLSASVSDKELVKAFENGMHFFCPKPVETTMLANVLKIRRKASTLQEALVEIGKQAVRVESTKIVSGSSMKGSRLKLRVKSDGSGRSPETADDDEMNQMCTGAFNDVQVSKNHTGWKIFQTVSRLLTGVKGSSVQIEGDPCDEEDGI